MIKDVMYKRDLEEVQKNGLLLQKVKDQTLEICLAAVQHYSDALQYVREKTPEILEAAQNTRKREIEAYRERILREHSGVVRLDTCIVEPSVEETNSDWRQKINDIVKHQ